ncbi:MAG: hypothetical protein QM608_01520 [Caulobacter sp.]
MNKPRKDLAAAVMGLATRDPPAGRAEWAGAMQAEFAALETGRLSWALGCLATTAVWRAPGEAVYAAALAGSVFFVQSALIWLLWMAMVFKLVSFDTMFDLQMPLLFSSYIGLSALIGAYRPDRRFLTALVMGLAPSLIGFALMGGFGRLTEAEVMAAPAPIGWAAMIGISYFSASVGAGLRRRLGARA